MDQLAGHPWERVDELLELAKRDAVEAQALPESVTLIFHDDGLSGILFTPTFVTETADEVTEVLCHVVPPLRARGVAVIWPAMYSDGDRQWWTMKVHRWDADVPGRVQTQIWPLPIRETPDGPPMDIEPPDPWSKRLVGALTDPGPLAALGVLDTTGLPRGFEFVVAPGGVLDAPLSHGLS